MSSSDVASRLGEHARALTAEECWDRMRDAPLGRVAYIASDGHPTVVPVNHGVDGGSIVFRSFAGSKLATAASREPVTFEVDGFDPASRSGWSVLAKGRATLVTDDEEVTERFGTGLTTWGSSSTHATVWVRIEVVEVTGLEVIGR